MTGVFRLDLLPAREGDCLVLAWGDPDRPRRLMVDTGRLATYRQIRRWLGSLPDAEQTFELLIVSHVDRDHIEGVVAMLSDPEPAVRFRDVWFNGYHHLQAAAIEHFGPVQGEALSDLLRRPGGSWNDRFGGQSVELGRVGAPVELADGLRLTLLGPDRGSLEALIPTWDKECRHAGLVRDQRGWRRIPPGVEAFGPIDVVALGREPFEPDDSPTNATSITVVAEYEGRRVVLAADAGADRLARSLAGLAAPIPGSRVSLAALKLPHHGSRYNLSEAVLATIDCPRFLVSSNGSYFGHPHRQALARLLVDPGRRADIELVFNYRSEETGAWDDDALRKRYRYTTRYPEPASNGTIGVDLLV